MELCHFNQIGRFTNKEPDIDSALFHLEQAAACDIIEANRGLAKIYLQLPHEVLEGYIVQVQDLFVFRPARFNFILLPPKVLMQTFIFSLSFFYFAGM